MGKSVKGTKIERNLLTAFAGESQASNQRKITVNWGKELDYYQ
jgi:rubrerythrin